MNRKSHYPLIGATAFASGLLGATLTAHGQVSLSSGSYSESFDSLPSGPNNSTSGVWTNNSTLPGWFSTRSTLIISDGSLNNGGLYDVGTIDATDRALGGIGSGGTSTFYWGAQFQNDAGAGLAIDSFSIGYTGEQWRDGAGTNGAASVAQSIFFEYSTDAISISGGTWTPFNALDFTSPTVGATTGVALDGNATANRTVFSAATVASSLNVAPGGNFWVRWRDINDASNDHALAVDDFNLTYTTIPYVAPNRSLTWDANTATAGIQDGSNTWVNGGNNWDEAGANVTYGTAASNDDATFGTGSGAGSFTVTVGGPVAANKVTFAGGPAYTIGTPGSTNVVTIDSGLTADGVATIEAPIALTNTQNWVVNGINSVTVNGQVSGQKILKAGTGTLRLSNASNSHAGIQLDAGTLVVGSNGELGDPSASLATQGGTIQFVAPITFPGPGGGAGGRTFSLMAGATTFDTNGNDIDIDGDLIGGGALIKTGAGTLTLSNPSESDPALRFTGTTTINAGTIKVDAHVGNFTAVGGGNLTVNNGATFHIDNVDMGVFFGSASARVFLNNGSTLIGTGTASYNRGSDALTIQNGTSSSANLMDIKTLSATDVFTIGNAVRQLTALNSGSAEQDTHATIRISGPGTIVLNNARADATTTAFAGSWQIDSGTLKIAHAAGGNITGEPLHALGYKLGDMANANAVTVNGGLFAVGVDQPNPQPFPLPDPPPPSYLRNPIILAGGSIAATDFQIDATGTETAVAVSANLAGALTTVASTTSKILTYDPIESTGARTVNIIEAGNTTLNGALVIDPGATTGGIVNIARTGGTVSIGAGASINVLAGSIVNLSGTNVLSPTEANGVALTVGGSFNVAVGENHTIKVSSLAVPAGGLLNLADNDLLVDYTGTSPEFDLRDLVKAVAEGGASGIGFEVGSGNTVIAIAEGTESGLADLNGVPFPDDTVVIGKYTYYGDANLDGQVTSDDYVAVDVGIGVGNSWVEGDFDFSGNVTSDDYVAIDVNLGQGSGNPLAFAELKAEMIALHTAMFGDSYVQRLAIAEAEGFAALVPEPGALSLVGLVGAALLGRRRRAM